MTLRVLLCLRSGYGLGDVAQFGIVLKHLSRYRPDWTVDCVAPRGTSDCVQGLCEVVWEQVAVDKYDRVIELHLHEHGAWYDDRPSTKMAWVLRHTFNIPEYDADLGSPQCLISHTDLRLAQRYLRQVAFEKNDNDFHPVVLHYRGGSSPHRKNLDEWQAAEICRLLVRCGRTPIILNWSGPEALADGKTIFCPGRDNELWETRDGVAGAGRIAALISCAEAYVGVDSGPGKLASTTKTPSLICWTKNHPLRFHDPAINTDHLVPKDNELPEEVQEYFYANYTHATYTGSHALVAKAQSWLLDLFGLSGDQELTSTTFVMVDGLEDAAWALLKLRAQAAGRPVDILLSQEPLLGDRLPAKEFLEGFPFIRSVRVTGLPVLHNCAQPTNNRGRFCYVADGPRGPFHFLLPQTVLEAGRRIEEWLPEYPVDWDVFDTFAWQQVPWGGDAYVAFCLGPEKGNTTWGMNRGQLWKPRDWIELGAALRERGVRNIVLLGGTADQNYWEGHLEREVRRSGQNWINLIDRYSVRDTLALLREARLVVGYPYGYTVLAHYLGVPVVTWWRPDGDSQERDRLVSWDERMRHGWTNPKYADRYLGCLYGREEVGDILGEIDRKGWLKHGSRDSNLQNL